MSFSLCKFFNSQQGCRFGNKCRYKHSEPSFSPASEYSWNQDEGSVSTPELHAPTTLVSRQHSQQVLLQNNALVTAGAIPDTVSSPSIPLQGISSQDGVSVSTAEQVEILPTFSLEPESLGSKKQDESSVSSGCQKLLKSTRKPCHYFTKYGNCRYGNRCHFQHVQSQHLPPRFEGQQKSIASTDDEREKGVAASESSDAEGERSAKGVWMKNFNNQEDKTTSRSCKKPDPPCNTREQEDGSELYYGTEKDSRNKRGGRERLGRVCQFYLSGRCWRGPRCKFLHPKFDTSSPAEATPPANNTARDKKAARERASKGTVSSVKIHPKAPYIPQGVKKWNREEVDDVEAARLRRTEIDLLQKRFPPSKMQIKKDTLELFVCVATFVPTDPDWPFDVKSFDLQVTIPADYPLEMLTMTLPSEQNLPETVRRYLEASIEEWLEEKVSQLAEKNQVELVFRPFLRWLDRNIEDAVTDGLRQLKRELLAKSAGLEFISAKELQKQYPGKGENEQDDDSDDNDDDHGNSENTQTSDSGDEESSSDSEYDDDDDDDEEELEENLQAEEATGKGNPTRKAKEERLKALLADPERKGTEITLKNMQLKESAAALYFDKIYLAIQCDRCKGTSEFLTSGGRTNVVQCGRCGQTQVATFRPALVHQYSAAIGFLDLDACLPFDVILQNCCTVITCFNCSKETKMGALLAGQPQDHWCRACHHKLKVATDGVRFTQLSPSNAAQELKGAVRVVVPRQRRLPKDPAIQEGKPLPSFGTCKHYKKSYRWLRFPCCGKCYPCDICHDSKEDHEMKFANRMICGFCCKEQVYAAEKPCKGCDLNLTKVHTKHWEGGQGCRDKITMCRNDKQKHRSMNKTVSKHSQKVKDMQSKKKTKLRHT